MTKILSALIPALAVALIAGSSALAQSEIKGMEEATAPVIDLNASWPCVQRKVEALSVSQVWDGPTIEGVKGWNQEEGIGPLINKVTSRRVPLAEAEAAIKKFADAQPADKRDERLTLLFAGIFDKMARERRTIMAGIEKYQKAQQERAKGLEKQSSELADIEKTATESDAASQSALEKAREQFNWAQRIFQERQVNIPLACELPVLVEERLYAVAQSIRANMS